MLELDQNSKTSSDEEQKERVRTFFDHSDSWRGEIYGDQNDRFNKAMLRRREYALAMLRTHVDSPEGKSVLDIGCGCGAYLEELGKMGMDPYGLDLSPAMIQECRKRLRVSDEVFSSHFATGDIEAIPFPAEQFDVVVSIGVFGYLTTDDAALEEVWRVLKPGGLFLVSVQNAMSLSNIDFVLRTRLRRMIAGKKGVGLVDTSGISVMIPWVTNHSETHHSYKSYNPWKWSATIEQHGFQQVDSMTFGQEFRLFRRLKLIPESLLTASEIALDRLFRRARLPYFSQAGESHTGLFRKKEEDNGLHDSWRVV